MNDMTPDREERKSSLKGMGSSRKRVEDARFTQGKGNYVDDIKLDGMLSGDFVRSPYAHARVVDINTEAALKVPGVLAVLTAKDLEPLGLHWMPTLAGDKQMVLADGKVLFQGQEVAFVIAKDRFAAADGIEAVEVEYEELPVLTDPFEALKSDVVLREDLDPKADGAHGPRKHHNHIFTWEAGEKDATEQVLAEADVVAEEMIYYHRTHPCPLETCGCVASMDKVNGKLTLWGTFQAPHAIRTVVSLISGIEEHNIRVISPDIGGGFGNKVGAYAGYVCSVVASIVTGQPVKWIEDRMDNLMTTAFARDYWMQGKISATKDGKITGLWCHTTADHGGFDACADPTKFPAGFMNICTGSYDIPTAYLAVDGVYTNKAPGGVAYRCSFRVTEAAYFIERMVEVLAIELNMDAAELRRINFIKKDQFPYNSALGWEYDSGDYHTAWDKALKAVNYDDLRKEQSERVAAFQRGETRKLLGIGLTHFTEIVGAGPVKNCDILGLGMFDSCEIRIHPTGSAIARLGTISQGQGHATTFAQILATEIGLPADSITIEEGDTDTAPYGLGTYGSRSTPVAGAATAMAGRKIRAKAQMIAAYLLEVHDDDVEFDVDRFVVKGAPERFKTMKDIAFASYNQAIPGLEPGLEAVSYYDPPNMTYPFGAYICVMELDVDTGEHEIRQFYALDDCGTRINPMIIEGQVHGGLTEALAIAMGQEIAYDEMGNVKTGTLMDFFLPTAWETPHYTTDHTTTPSPHHPIGAKGVGESPNVGGVPAFSNAVHDAFRAFGLRQAHMPHDHWRVWKIANDLGLHD
ncbi:MAG: aerobic carbon-monoxide dehydrogenase large subunit [Paracoccaceae bacterium]|jgi:carbon-monoxide dehydrogenase large subunit|nr:carbon-monoxide dehydrogenase large subunit [Paracoccaceae bacterium]MBL6640524.1 carbon-monoxide dehydrogenase large subunit [Paracoccaceae bacterium]MBL6676383.1 carbon-monoxide dehydrogenase large subunit [Paracoccaceae bacterium]MBL6788649.1 carbon-monoxide dehydrogenase large subunit [Paracoccaceae bacterium]MBL6859464.1 carbon-monoxide dehydrogenase large subunit [Paracoccaceae bacterium]